MNTKTKTALFINGILIEMTQLKLQVLDELPSGFLDVDPEQLETILSGPTLIRLQGRTDPPIFVSTLLHGNEPTGFRALQELLASYRRQGHYLPRSLWIFIGNVRAAKYHERRLENQPDYNRIWNGGDLPENRLAGQVLEAATARGLFASIDVHNRNPHYACMNRLDGATIRLAQMFSRTLVYFLKPPEVLSIAFKKYCPSITVEGGQPHDLTGVRHVADFLDQCLNLDSIPTNVVRQDLDLYHSVARVQVPKNSRIGFHLNCGRVDFCFIKNLDRLNFTEVPEGTVLGWRNNPEMHLSAQDEKGQEVEGAYFEYRGNEILFKRAVVPSLFSTDEHIVHQDCLGYLMERYELP
jgi:hypothetical protein